MGFIRDVLTYDAESGASSKRLVLVVAGISLSICAIMLSAGALLGYEVEMALWAVTTPLCAMSGAAYIGKREAYAIPNDHDIGKKG